MGDPKYSKPEIERRWLVDPASVPASGNGESIEDLYIEGTRMRLRKWTMPDGSAAYKLAKKYGATKPGVEPMTNLYLTREEWEILNRLEGHRISKTRYPQPDGGVIDLFEDFAIYEVEFKSEEEAWAYTPPSFVGREITGESEWSGLELARR